MMTLGFNFAGTEELFEQMLELAVRERSSVNFQSLEIGTATGRTLLSIADFLRDRVTTWRATSVDLVDGHYFNTKEFLKMSLAHQVGIEFCGNGRREPFVSDEHKNDIRVLLLKSPDKRAICASNSVNFVLIDGCHGAPCVEADFLSVERAVCDGGILAFHDAGLNDQGKDPQLHCNEPINIRPALEKLRLLGLAQRTGWRQVAFMEGDKERSGNGIIFFQKQAVPQHSYQEGFTG